MSQSTKRFPDLKYFPIINDLFQQVSIFDSHLYRDVSRPLSNMYDEAIFAEIFRNLEPFKKAKKR